MLWLNTLSLVLLGLTWFAAWRIGRRWCRACGVQDHLTVWVLGTIAPTAGLVASVHLVAFTAMLSGRGLVSPAPVLLLYFLAVWITHHVVRRRLPTIVREELESKTLTEPIDWRIAAFPVAAIGALYLVSLIEAATRFPTGYDGLHYHLPMAVGWMQTGSLDLVVGQMHRSLPGNAMLVPMLLSFAGGEKLIALMNVPNGMLLGACVWGLCRALKLTRTISCVSVCIALSVPIVVRQSFSSYVDLYAADCWLLSLLALVWSTRADTAKKRMGLIVLAGLAGGIALGCKPVYLVLVFFLGLIAVAVEWIRRPATFESRRTHLRNGLIFGLAALVCSSFWFVRGAVQAGNPVYPLAVTIAGEKILPGFTDGDWFPNRTLATKIGRWWSYPWTERKFAGSGETYSVNNSLGAAYAALVPIGVLAALATVFRRRPQSAEDKCLFVYLVLVLLGVGLLLSVFEEVLRYVLGPVLIAVPVAAVMVQRLVKGHPRWTAAVLHIAIAVTVTIAVLEPARALVARVQDSSWSRSAFYQLPDVIDTYPPGTRILNLAPPPLTYPLSGSRHQNEVISASQWLTIMDGEGMTARLLVEHGIDYVYLRQPPTGRPWIDADWPPEFPVDLVFDDSATNTTKPTPASRIYRVARSTVAMVERSFD